jgi:hypothetical protein
MRNLRLVKQRKGTECGIACFAMLAGISLPDARRKINEAKEKLGIVVKSGYTDDEQIRTALKPYGIRLGDEVGIRGGKTKKQSAETRKKNWGRLTSKNETALVATGYHETETEEKFHWVLFNGNGNDEEFEILDPKVGKRVTTGKLRIAWYHLVKWRRT